MFHCLAGHAAPIFVFCMYGAKFTNPLFCLVGFHTITQIFFQAHFSTGLCIGENDQSAQITGWMWRITQRWWYTYTYVEGLKAKCFTPACDIYVPIYRKKYYAFVRWQMGYTHVRPICFNLFPQISTFFCQFLKKIHVNILGFNPPTLEDPFKRIFG